MAMEEFFKIEIPPILLLVFIAVFAAIYFYVVKKYGDLAESDAEAVGSERTDGMVTSPPGIDRKKLVAITAAAVAVLNKNKSGRNRTMAIR